MVCPSIVQKHHEPWSSNGVLVLPIILLGNDAYSLWTTFLGTTIYVYICPESLVIRLILVVDERGNGTEVEMWGASSGSRGSYRQNYKFPFFESQCYKLISFLLYPSSIFTYCLEPEQHFRRVKCLKCVAMFVAQLCLSVKETLWLEFFSINILLFPHTHSQYWKCNQN